MFLIPSLKRKSESRCVQGYIVGNGVTDEQIDGNALVPFVHGMGLISDELFEVKMNPLIKSKFETLSFV
jgi:hypothetical protein